MSLASFRFRKKKIHFAALVGVDVDLDILPWWVNHYKALALDSYRVFLHASQDVKKNTKAWNLLESSGFTCHHVPFDIIKECFGGDPDGLRRELLTKYAKTLPEGDFLITADGDEFQQWAELPGVAVERGVSVMLGTLIDRYDETLHDPHPDHTLDYSYPYAHSNLCTYFHHKSLNTKKICMAPASYPVEFSGSHSVIPKADIRPGLIISGPMTVWHYRWRKSAVARVEGRSYWSPEEIEKMKAFFS